MNAMLVKYKTIKNVNRLINYYYESAYLRIALLDTHEDSTITYHAGIAGNMIMCKTAYITDFY